MILPYGARLVCLCFAVFFLVHTVSALAVCLAGARAIRYARRMAPVRGARLLLILRLLPAALSLFVVAALCTPSYLWLEPAGVTESTGVVCLAAAISGLALWCESMVGVMRAVVRSLGYLRRCRQHATHVHLPSVGVAAWIIEEPSRVMLAGVFQPRLVISRNVLSALPREQLSAVIRHERAHGVARDNLKRLLMLLAPGMLPFVSGFRDFERHWARLSEWAADDRASGGRPRRCLALAAALVRVARLGSPSAVPALATSLIADGADLSERVDRLLHPARREHNPADREPVLAASAALLLAGALTAVIAHPVTLHSAHEFLEFLIQ